MLGLIVPGFEPSAIESLFGRFRYRVCPTVLQTPGHLNAIRYVAGISPEAFDRFPAGPIAAFSTCPDRASTGTWLRAQPVHHRVFSDHAAVLWGDTLAVSDEELADWAGALNGHLGEHDAELVCVGDGEWCLQVQRAVDCVTVPLDVLPSADPFAGRPVGKDAPWLENLMTEIQMLCHDHPLNDARLLRDAPPLTGVWLSEPGTLPPKQTAKLPPLCTHSPFALGLWALSGARCLNGESAEGWAGWLDLGQNAVKAQNAIDELPQWVRENGPPSFKIVSSSGVIHEWTRRTWWPWSS